MFCFLNGITSEVILHLVYLVANESLHFPQLLLRRLLQIEFILIVPLEHYPLDRLDVLLRQAVDVESQLSLLLETHRLRIVQLTMINLRLLFLLLRLDLKARWLGLHLVEGL